MRRHAMYETLAALSLGLGGAAAFLAIAGAALQQSLGVAAASLCAALLAVPGLYFVAYARRLRAREVALVHAAAFARSRESLRIRDLAEELQVPPGDAEKILRTAVEEGYLAGRFEPPDRFVPGGGPTAMSEGEP